MIQAEDPGLLQQTDRYDMPFTHGPAIEPSARSSASPAAVSLYRISARVLFGLCAVSILAQAVLMVVDPQATFASNVLIVLEFFFAAAGCLKHASRESAETRTLWILFAAGFFISIAGQIESTYESLMPNPPLTATMADVFFLIYGIPILLAISFTNEEADLRVLFWLNGAQAIVAAVLIYFQIFTTAPLAGHSTAISLRSLMYVYNVENLLRAGAVTLRLFGNPPPTKRRFYVALSIYLWTYAVVALSVGYLELARNAAQGLQDAFWGLPCLVLLGVLAFQPRRLSTGSGPHVNSNRSIALLLDNLSPVLFTLVIVFMGARIAPPYHWIGFASIAVAVAIYGLRSALLQSKYLRSQQQLAKSGAALVDAFDRLRDLSIRDGLTGIYNRRHLDEVLLSEWKRSIRTEKPCR